MATRNKFKQLRLEAEKKLAARKAQESSILETPPPSEMARTMLASAPQPSSVSQNVRPHTVDCGRPQAREQQTPVSSGRKPLRDLQKLPPRSVEVAEKPPPEKPKTSKPEAQSKPESPRAVQNPPPQFPRQMDARRMSDRYEYVKNVPYKIIGDIGKGGSSVVHHVFSDCVKDTLALKVVDFDEIPDIVREGYRDEVKLLEELQNSENVIKLYAYEERDNKLYVVMEKGDIDFQGILKKGRIKPETIKHYWRQMLTCVEAIHKNNIVHSDLKPANFLCVKGYLKLIDFGIASKIPTDHTSVAKDVQSGTLNYMSPESLLSHGNTFKVPLSADVWALGCILYLMVYGHPPFSAYTSTAQRMHAITSDKVEIQFDAIEDPLLLDVMKKCLQRDCKLRPTVTQLLQHPYLEHDHSHTQNSRSFADSNGASTTEDMFDQSFYHEALELITNKTPRTAARHIMKIRSQNTSQRSTYL